MKYAFFLVVVAVTICSCANDVPAVIGFEYDRLSPLMYQFTNTSVGFDEYKWDFGDGTFSFGTNAMHEFATTGTYTVTLIGMYNGSKYDFRQTIDVSVPAVCFAGYTLYSIPYQDRYYKVVFKDDALFPSSWDFQSQYTPMLDDSDLPYTIYFRNAREAENIDSHDYYTVQVIRTTDASTTAHDVSCMKQKITVKQLKQYQPQYILETESGSTIIGIRMEYRY